MAVIYPDFENIARLKVEPTKGELYLLRFLEKKLDDSYEVFFNPYLDGDRPDIIILREKCAAFVIEVKDWNLSSYQITKDNRWEVYNNLKYNSIKSPPSQAYRYKSNLYNLHLPVIGLKSITNKNFYNLIDCYVYFHGTQEIDINQIYEKPLENIRKDLKELNASELPLDKLQKRRDYLQSKKKQLERDKNISFCSSEKSLHGMVSKIKNKYRTRTNITRGF